MWLWKFIHVHDWLYRHLIQGKETSSNHSETVSKFLQLVNFSFPMSFVIQSFLLINFIIAFDNFCRSNMLVVLMIMRKVSGCWIKKFQSMRYQKTVEKAPHGGSFILHFLHLYILQSPRWLEIVAWIAVSLTWLLNFFELSVFTWYSSSWYCPPIMPVQNTLWFHFPVSTC